MLDKSVLKGVLQEWSFWGKPFPFSIPRKVLKTQNITLSPDIVCVIQGVRRCGKSTLLAQMVQYLKLPVTACTFVNFEDPRLSQDLTTALLDQIVSFSKKEFPSHHRYYFFLDEIQNV
ncbi:MAG: AAA family ATPase, partial [Deltaproteobacteria bacterium]|nr:AAA family ATPase [Deltaproteobacteria bacterium]